MTYIYLDESGDLGFNFSKAGTSRHFSIAFLLTENKRPISSLVKKVFLSLPPATKRKNSGVLHAHHEKSVTVNAYRVSWTMIDSNGTTWNVTNVRVLVRICRINAKKPGYSTEQKLYASNRR